MSRGKLHLPVDLHLHSTASDGSLAPEQLIAGLPPRPGRGGADRPRYAGRVEEALSAGRRCGLILPGWRSALLLKAGDSPARLRSSFPEKISAVLDELRRERYLRMEKMLARLRRLGFGISDAEVISEAGSAAPGRLHLARLMVKLGYTPDIDTAFSLYLERGRPAFVPRTILDPAGAITLLHRAGAVPVVAHPGASGRGLLRKLVAVGLRGIEVIHPEHTPEMVRYYRHQAKQMGLLITGGSDYHGDRDYRAGRPGGFTVPYRCLAAIKEAPRGLP